MRKFNTTPQEHPERCCWTETPLSSRKLALTERISDRVLELDSGVSVQLAALLARCCMANPMCHPLVLL